MKEEILFLNLLRFFACINVVCAHFFVTLISLGYLPFFLDIVSPLAQYGYLGVNLFFLISGFVISLSSEGRTIREFAFARFIRLYPVFWVCVCITTLLAVFFNSRDITLAQFLANLTMIPDAFGNYAYIDGVYWTLAIEMRFYFFIALLLWLRSYIKIDLQKGALFLVSLLVIKILLSIVGSTSIFSQVISIFIVDYWSGYAAYFIAGMLFYGIYENRKTYLHYPALLLCYVVALGEALHRSYETNNKIIVALYITLFFGMLTLLSLKKINNSHFTFLGSQYTKILVLLGAVTYPLYLLHSSVIHALLDLFTYMKLPAFIASPLLFLIVLSLLLFINRFDVYIREVLKKKNNPQTQP